MWNPSTADRKYHSPLDRKSNLARSAGSVNQKRRKNYSSGEAEEDHPSAAGVREAEAPDQALCSAARAASSSSSGVRGSPTPIIESRVTSWKSCASLQPSVPFGRRGTMR